MTIKHLNLTIPGVFDITRDVFDMWYAFKQSQSPTWSIETKVTEGEYNPQADLNILCLNQPLSLPDNIDNYELVILMNGVEDHVISNELIVETLQRPRTILIAGSRLHKEHPLYDKIIVSDMGMIIFREFWTRYYYPQYYASLRDQQRCKSKDIIFINGQNRAHRHHFSCLLKEFCPEIPQRNAISTGVHETLEQSFELPDDAKFRAWVNNYYNDTIHRNVDLNESYYKQSVPCGINGRFGSVNPGGFIIDEFWDYRMVIYPETSWVNDALHITEKSMKCFFAKSFAWPIAGRHVNALYKEIGFYTAWNLLPKELQEFDNIMDHNDRYCRQIDSIKWLHKHPEVFNTPDAKNMLLENYINLHSYTAHLEVIGRFDSILEQHRRL